MAVVGIDFGATKTHFAVAVGGRSTDLVVPTTSWRVGRDEESARALLALVRPTAGAEPAVLVVDAHGCDDAARCLAFKDRLAALACGARAASAFAPQ